MWTTVYPLIYPQVLELLFLETWTLQTCVGNNGKRVSEKDVYVNKLKELVCSQFYPQVVPCFVQLPIKTWYNEVVRSNLYWTMCLFLR